MPQKAFQIIYDRMTGLEGLLNSKRCISATCTYFEVVDGIYARPL